MAKAKKGERKKSGLAKKLARALDQTTLAEIQQNLGAMLSIRRLPGAAEYQCFLSNTGIKKKGAKNSGSDHISCNGTGNTPSKACRNLAKKLRGKVLYPTDGGPCKDRRKEMVIQGKVLPL